MPFLPGNPGGGYHKSFRSRVSQGRPRNRTGSHVFTPGPSSTGRRGGNRPAPSPAVEKYGSATDSGDKPREERSYLEFHPEFETDAVLQVYDSREVDGVAVEKEKEKEPTPESPTLPADAAGYDGVVPDVSHLMEGTPLVNGLGITAATTDGGANVNGTITMNGHASTAISSETSQSSQHEGQDQASQSTPRRGRPPRKGRTQSSSSLPKPVIPAISFSNIHAHEKLSLPLPQYRPTNHFSLPSYIDRTMAAVGFQETDFWARPRTLVRNVDVNNAASPTAASSTETGLVEYDMDEQDDKWLVAYNHYRRESEVPPISRELFEVTITKVEREWSALEKRIPKQNHSAASRRREGAGEEENEDSKCQICDDGECENSNAIVFCDGCDLAVHQDCYGVPFIPEGQWLCRKCQLLTPRQHANCIFCPNTDGAFKQTTQNRWCHLLCAIWIPEVTLLNPVYMEPIGGVELVPKPRWKLHCYICRQKMGACIQCSNKSCYLAFHVTCARRAGLYLKMKAHVSADNNGERNPLLDGNLLKAFCDKHVPHDFRIERGTDDAIIDAQEFYELTMYDRDWPDSQASALALPEAGSPTTLRPPSTLPRVTFTIGGGGLAKRKRAAVTSSTAPRVIWRLPSGAPVVPFVLYNTLIDSLSKFNVRKIKEYVAEICKYWTLKRESRRDASLVKRTQVEAFTSDEVTRRQYKRRKGGEKLKRRLEFAVRLQRDLDRVRMLCDEVRKREREKLRGAECLREMVDVVYFPITPLVRPMLERAVQLDTKGLFKPGLAVIKQRMQNREYGTVKSFATDLATLITTAIATTRKTFDVAVAEDTIDAEARTALKATLDQASATKTRIQKALQILLADAYEKERGLREDPNEKLAAMMEDQLSRPAEAMDVDTPVSGVGGIPDEDREIVGLPWYTLPFSPEGLNLLAEERWMGWDVVRDMSPLSEIGEDELEDLNKPAPMLIEESPDEDEEESPEEEEIPGEEEEELVLEEKPKKATRKPSTSTATRPKKRGSTRAKRPKYGAKKSSRASRSKAEPAAKPKRMKGYVMVEEDDEEEEAEEAGDEAEPERELDNEDEEMLNAVEPSPLTQAHTQPSQSFLPQIETQRVPSVSSPLTPSPDDEDEDEVEFNTDDEPISPLRPHELMSLSLPFHAPAPINYQQPERMVINQERPAEAMDIEPVGPVVVQDASTQLVMEMQEAVEAEERRLSSPAREFDHSNGLEGRFTAPQMPVDDDAESALSSLESLPEDGEMDQEPAPMPETAPVPLGPFSIGKGSTRKSRTPVPAPALEMTPVRSSGRARKPVALVDDGEVGTPKSARAGRSGGGKAKGRRV